MRRGRVVRLGVAAAAMLMVVPACSSDRSDNDAGDTATDGSSASAELPTKTFGDLEVPCGAGDASGATDPGVTDDAINIGYGDDSGYVNAPGLNEEMGDAMDALVAWCNDLGGINGRQIVGHRYDAKLTDSAQVAVQACEQDFMLVGQGFAGDENMEAERINCGLVSVPGFTLSAAATNAPMMYQPVPQPVDFYNQAKLQLAVDTYPEMKSAFDFINHDSNFVQIAQKRTVGALDKIGIDPLDCGVLVKSAGGDNYRALVQRFQKCGAEALFDQATPTPAMYSFFDAMKTEGFEPRIVTESAWYADQVLAANVSGVTEGLNIALSFQPFENADAVPAVRDYLAIMGTGDYETGLLGMQSTSAFMLWAQAAKACGSELTRQCMVNELAKVEEWTGGGLHSVGNPAANEPPRCALLVEVQGGEFVQVAPETKGEFVCVDAPLKIDKASWGIDLNEDGIATTYLTDDVLTPEG